MSNLNSMNNPPITGPRPSAKLELLQGFRAKRAEAEREVISLLKKFREDPSAYKMTEADRLALLLNHSQNRGLAEAKCTGYNRVAELKYLLNAQSGVSVTRLSQLIGIGPQQLFALRRQDAELDQMIKDYMASFFEDEAMTQDKGLHPALVIFGLKSQAGWMDAKDRAISMEQLSQITEGFCQVLREELAGHPALLTRIEARLRGDPAVQIIDAVAQVKE